MRIHILCTCTHVVEVWVQFAVWFGNENENKQKWKWNGHLISFCGYFLWTQKLKMRANSGWQGKMCLTRDLIKEFGT